MVLTGIMKHCMGMAGHVGIFSKENSHKLLELKQGLVQDVSFNDQIEQISRSGLHLYAFRGNAYDFGETDESCKPLQIMRKPLVDLN